MRGFTYSTPVSDTSSFVKINSGNQTTKIVQPLIYGGWFSREATGIQVGYQVVPQNIADYAGVPGVDSVAIVLDGRMNLCEEFAEFNMDSDPCPCKTCPCGCTESPTFDGISNASLDRVALGIAQKFCIEDTNDVVGGIHVDLEPLGLAKYQAPVVSLLTSLSKALTDTVCISAKFPSGRSVSVFGFAEDCSYEMLDALGVRLHFFFRQSFVCPLSPDIFLFFYVRPQPNGMVILSGYDLYPDLDSLKKDNFHFNSISEYKEKLARQLNVTRLAFKNHQTKFSIAIPISAS